MNTHRENKEFPNEVYSSLHGLLLVQRTNLDVSRVTIDASLHLRGELMIFLIQNQSTLERNNL